MEKGVGDQVDLEGRCEQRAQLGAAMKQLAAIIPAQPEPEGVRMRSDRFERAIEARHFVHALDVNAQASQRGVADAHERIQTVGHACELREGGASITVGREAIGQVAREARDRSEDRWLTGE
jgi:hypothetical protein